MPSSQPYQDLAMRAIRDFLEYPQFRDEAGNLVPRTLDDVYEDLIEYVTPETAEAYLADMMLRYPEATARAFMSMDLTDLAPWQVVRSLTTLILGDVIAKYRPEIFAENERRENLGRD